LAWDVVAGGDYFFNPQWGAFIEYHYLDYTSSRVEASQSRDLGSTWSALVSVSFSIKGEQSL
jgi:hypothetical protein